ncbi:MAG: hypothetical protein Kow0060_04720 [Methylohalobius crimeensis]
MAKKPFLVTLLPSVDVDLGRWLLQHWGIDYEEHPHAPVFHILALKWYGVGKDQYPLFISEGRKYPAIEAMVEALDPLAAPENRLVPDPVAEKALHDEVMKLQNEVRFGLGKGTVDWCYYHFLPRKDLTWASFTTGVPWWETLFLTFGYGLIKSLMFKGLDLTPESARKGLDRVLAGFDKIDALLADGRSFLAGDRLTLADLAFATSAAPMVLADGYGGHLPTIDRVPPEMFEVMSDLRRRPAGKFIQRLYDEYRKTPPPQTKEAA